MVIDSKYYVHESDKAALTALKAIPGFSQLLKAYMKVWHERQYQISNMSSCIRINENQLVKYHYMLLNVCGKLGIEVPELYLKLDVSPNSYTYGDTKPFVVITSGLIETLPDHLIETVFAHECGHIACHHTLYGTMGRFILNSAFSTLSMLPFGNLISLPIQVAFYYWMRCSEFSADRAAVLCDGTAEKMSEVCMRLSGFNKNINASANKVEFLKQAQEYRASVSGSAWNRVLEFMLLSNVDHPLTAVRALECIEWSQSEQFAKILDGSILQEKLPDEEPVSTMWDTLDEQVKEFDKQKMEFPKFWKKQKTDELLQLESKMELEIGISVPDEIRKYKELLDDGIITEEEFMKKKELLLKL